MAQSLPTYTPPQKKGNFFLGKSVPNMLYVDYLYRNWKYEQEIAGLLWKVDLNDIQGLNNGRNSLYGSKVHVHNIAVLKVPLPLKSRECIHASDLDHPQKTCKNASVD